MLSSAWSKELAETMFHTRRIAIRRVRDAVPTARPAALFVEEVAFLACTVHNSIEVLYMVDYLRWAGCQTCGRSQLRAADLQKRDGSPNSALHGDAGEDGDESTRPGDVIYGVGKTYREVFDLEALGWHDLHPAYAFARVIGEAVRSQQREGPDGAVRFRGVRILVAEDEAVPGIDHHYGGRLREERFGIG